MRRWSKLPPPSDIWDALALRHSRVAEGAAKKRRARPTKATLRLPMLCDAYHKVSAASPLRQEEPRGRRGQRVMAAVRNARRRVWAL